MKKIYATTLVLIAYLGSADTKAQVTFNNDVAPIIFSKCAPCHNPNGINSKLPFTNYNEVAGDTSGIHKDLLSGHMPPWSPDTTYTKFLHQEERTITAIQKNKILQWIANGAPQGGGTAPTCPTFVSSNKLAGTADLVVGLGPVNSNSNSSNANPYNCFVVPTGLTEDKWLRAVEIVPGNLQAVHHVVVTVDTTGTKTSDVSGSCTNQLGQFGIAGWSAGAAPVVYPNKPPLKAGQRIPKGSSICIQIHFAPGSGGMVDSTKVRLYFYNKDSLEGIRPLHDDVALQYWGLSFGGGSNPQNIPANTRAWIKANPGGFTSGGVLSNPQAGNTTMAIIATNPHSHLVCTKIKNYAFNGTDTIRLISIPDWRYHWQGYYYHPKPVIVPSTHTLESVHYFDNTSNNDDLMGYGAQIGMKPSNSVKFGTATTDEMLFDDFVWMNYQAGDENIDLGAIAAADTIFSNGSQPKPYEKTIYVVTPLTNIESINDVASNFDVHPNPAFDKVNIVVSGTSATYTGHLLNITGQTILQTGLFNNATVIDVSNVPAGLYILEIVNNKTFERTIKKLMVTH